MKLTFTVTILLFCALRYDSLVTCLRLEKEEEEQAVIGPPDDYDRNADNNTDIIKGENNWKTKEIEEISQSERRPNLKHRDPPRMRYRTVPDQFYDYAKRSSRHLKGIEDEKIPRENKKLGNIFVGNEDDTVVDRYRNGDSIKDLEDESKFRYYENTSVGDVFPLWKTQKFPESRSFYGRAKNFVGKYNEQANQENKLTFNQHPIQQIDQSNNDVKVDQLISSNPLNHDKEQQRIHDIREEVVKLRSLIEILRDQQYILKSLDDTNDKNNHLNKKKTITTTNSLGEGEMTEFKSFIENGNSMEENFAQKINILENKLDELDHLVKNVLFKAMLNENTSRKNWENQFESELKQFKKEFLNAKHFIFSILKKVLKQSNHPTNETHNSIDNSTQFTAILAELKELEKNITTIMEKEPKILEIGDFVGESLKKNLETSVEDPPVLRAKLDFARIDEENNSDLNKILEHFDEKELSNNRKNTEKKKLVKLSKELDQSEPQDSIETLMNELETKKEDFTEFDTDTSETLLGVVNLLNRLRKAQKRHKDKSESQNRNLMTLLRNLLGKSESKISKDEITNDNLISNLKELSEEIDHLRPKDDIVSNEDEDNTHFRTLLEKLINSDSFKPKLSTTPKPILTQKQITTLIGQLRRLVNKNTHKDDTGEAQENIFYTKIPQYGTYQCEKMPNTQPIQYPKPENLDYTLYPHNAQYIQDFHKPYHQQGSYNSDYDHEDIHQHNFNPHKLFRGYEEEGTQSSDNIRTFENPQYIENTFDASYPAKYSEYLQEDQHYAERRIQNLLAQVNNLKYALNSLNRPGYIQTEEDKMAVENLNIQTDNLQSIIYNLLNGATSPYYRGDYEAYPSKAYNFNQHKVNYMKPVQNYVKRERYLDVKHSETPKGHLDFDMHQHQSPYLSNQNQKSNMRFEVPEMKPQKQDLPRETAPNQQVRIAKYKKADDGVGRNKRATNNVGLNALSIMLSSLLDDTADQEQRTQKGNTKTEDFDEEDEYGEPLIENLTSDFARSSTSRRRHFGNQMNKQRRKKQDVFDKIFNKIIDKFMNSLQAAIPRFIERLFGLNIYYHSTNLYGDYSVQQPRFFGIGGYIPLIVLKIIYSVNSFVYELQKYPFIRNFFIPAGIVLSISGLVVFLIYWLQPSYYEQRPYPSYQNQPYNSYNQYKKPQYQNSYPSNSQNYYSTERYYPRRLYYKDNNFKNYEDRGGYRGIYLVNKGGNVYKTGYLPYKF